MTAVAEEVGTRSVAIPIVGGEVVLAVPEAISDQTLNKEIGVQDFIRKRLLDFIDNFGRIIESNRELFFCSEKKLRSITTDFLAECSELRKFITSLSIYHSAIPELEEARENVKAFFEGHISSEIDKVETVAKNLPPDDAWRSRTRHRELDKFRQRLGKSTGLVGTELQKIFAHLMARDPRNLYRVAGAKAEQEILFRQFKQEVETTEQLYQAVRALDTYMRGAIIPSDLLSITAERIGREKSVVCLFDPDYSLFLNALLDEIADQLLAELYSILDLDGIWYDDYENIRGKAKVINDFCSTFKATYLERCGLRDAISARFEAAGKTQEDRDDDPLTMMLATFNTYRYQEVAASIRKVDQILVDLEGALLQWEKGLTKRAFARAEWGAALPFHRRARGSGSKSIFA